MVEVGVDTTATRRRAKYRGGLLLLAGMAALGFLPSSGSAQVVKLTPYAGVSSPSRVSIRDGSLQLEQKIGLKVGARLTVSFNQHLDLLTSVSYTPGYAVVRAAGKQFQLRTTSQLLSGSTGARYWLVPPTGPLSWAVGANLDMGFGGQAVFDDLFDVSVLSGTLGTAVRYQIGQIVSLYLRVRERLFRVGLGSYTPPSSSRALQVSFGVTFPFLETAIRPSERETSW